MKIKIIFSVLLFTILFPLFAEEDRVALYIPYWRFNIDSIYRDMGRQAAMNDPVIEPSSRMVQKYPDLFALREYGSDPFLYYKDRITDIHLQVGLLSNEEEINKELNPIALSFLQRFNRLGVKTHITIFGNSAEFAPLCESESAATEYARSLSELAVNNGFSGIDIDWEFPRSETALSNYENLINAIREECDIHNLVLTICTSRYSYFDSEIMEIPDYIHLMIYDYFGRHSTYEQAVEAIDYYLVALEIDPSKIVAGVPFYGRPRNQDEWTDATRYRSLVEDYHPTPDKNELAGYYFNGRNLIDKKCQLIIDKELGGIFAWEMTYDRFDEYSLLRIIDSNFR